MNRLGHCTACQTQVFDVASVHRGTGDDRVDGSPKSISSAKHGAMLVTLVRSDGSQIKVTLCGPCCNGGTDRILTLWKNVCEQESLCLLDSEYRTARGGKALSDAQLEQSRKTLHRLVNNPPLGILMARPWKEIQHGRTGNH